MSREKEANRLLQGTLDLLILKTLDRGGVMHGYSIARHIQQVSREALKVEEGSLYPALHRMAQDSLISAEWGTTENNRRARYYEITPAGRERLKQEEENWERLTSAVARFLKYA